VVRFSAQIYSATCELIWLNQLLKQLKFEEVTQICDNEVVLLINSNPVFHENTKYIKIDYHFLCEKIGSRDIKIELVNLNDQLLDIFT